MNRTCDCCYFYLTCKMPGNVCLNYECKSTMIKFKNMSQEEYAVFAKEWEQARMKLRGFLK